MAFIGCKDERFIFWGKCKNQQNGGGESDSALHQCGQEMGARWALS